MDLGRRDRDAVLARELQVFQRQLYESVELLLVAVQVDIGDRQPDAGGSVPGL